MHTGIAESVSENAVSTYAYINFVGFILPSSFQNEELTLRLDPSFSLSLPEEKILNNKTPLNIRSNCKANGIGCDRCLIASRFLQRIPHEGLSAVS